MWLPPGNNRLSALMRQSFPKGENVGAFFSLQPLHLTVKAFIIGLGRIWVISIDYKFWQVLCQVQKAFINCSLLALLRCNFTFKMSSPLFPRLHVHQQRGLSHLEGKLGHCCFPSNSKKGEVCMSRIKRPLEVSYLRRLKRVLCFLATFVYTFVYCLKGQKHYYYFLEWRQWKNPGIWPILYEFLKRCGNFMRMTCIKKLY